jgi:hypothetical protein
MTKNLEVQKIINSILKGNKIEETTPEYQFDINIKGGLIE